MSMSLKPREIVVFGSRQVSEASAFLKTALSGTGSPCDRWVCVTFH